MYRWIIYNGLFGFLYIGFICFILFPCRSSRTTYHYNLITYCVIRIVTLYHSHDFFSLAINLLPIG